MQPFPVRTVAESAEGADRTRWPATVAAVRQVLDEGLELGRLTILVGENGTGKSTLVEAIAMAYGLSPEGGSTGARHSTRATESGLWRHLQLTRGAGASRWGYFLRAETLHGLYSYLEENGSEHGFHTRSHGESFLAMMATSRFADGGLFVLDEPESGLSFTAQLTLLGHLAELAEDPRSQVIMATHSPVLASIPGADLYELSETGLQRARWDELAVVDHYRRFLDAPQRYLRHVLPEPDEATGR